MYVLSFIFGVIQFTLISLILVQELKRKSPAIFMWATLFVMFAFPHLLTCIIEDMNYPTSIYLAASVFVCGFCINYLLIRTKKSCSFVTLVDERKFVIEPTGLEGSLFEYICFGIFLFAIIGYILYVIQSVGGLFNTSWSGAREIEHGYVSLSGLATRLIFMFSGLSLFYFLTKRRIKAVIVLLLFIGLILVTRNRVQVLPVMIFFVSLYLLKIKTIKIKHIVIGLLLAVVSIYIIYAIRAFRYLGTLSNATANFSWNYINATVKGFLNDRNGELGLRQYFYYFILNNNNFEGFNRGYTYIRMLLVYIPRQWSLGIKPQSFDLYMGRAIGMVAGGSTHPTIFGDCFGNMSWFGILLGALWASLSNGIDALITRQKDNFYKIMFFFLAAYSFVVIGRGSVYNGFEEFAWGVLFLFILKLAEPQLSRIRFTLGKYKKVNSTVPHSMQSNR